MTGNLINNLPSHLNPVILSVNGFELRWYSLAYLVAFLVFAWLVLWRIKNGELGFAENGTKTRNDFWDILLAAIAGLLLGARIGYGLFYDFDLIIHPWLLFYPFSDGKFVGIYGMSFFGGLAGSFLSIYILCQIKRLDFWNWLNFSVPVVGLAYFFGRLGNFLNGELYGRKTNLSWGMYFPKDPEGQLRHPSQLYESFFEGLVIFIILWPLRNNEKMKNKLFPLFLILYGFFRFLIEFVRGESVYGIFTTGQYLSLGIMIIGTVLIISPFEKGD